MQDYFIDVGIKLYVREWPGDGAAFMLVHGLASNSRTWDVVAANLAAAGHRVVAVDLRGHGLSDKPDDGYDFATITADLAQLIKKAGLNRPVLVGQSWGGNVLLEFGARYPALACGLAFIDGGFIDLRMRPGATWEQVLADLKPPDLAGTPRQAMKSLLKETHPEWGDAGVEGTLGNFETLPDGTIRPWLTLSRHIAILRAMWEQRPAAFWSQVSVPVLICAAEDRKNSNWMAIKAKQVAAIQAGLPNSEVHWFENTDHDIHVHRPEALTNLLLQSLRNGLWRAC